MTDASQSLPPELLEAMRRGLGLRMSAMGELTIKGEPVTHPGVLRVVRDGLDLSDGGETIVRIGPQWAYIEVDDCPLRATAVHVADGGATVRLDDGREVPLDPDTLVEERGHGLRCEAPARGSARPLAVRFTNRAQMDLAEHVEVDEAGKSVLVLGARRLPIRRA